jgi:phosphoglycolate phosphatase
MQLLIFDLDGTLIDSQLDLANSVNAARHHMKRDPLPNELIYTYVGDGAPVLLRRAMGAEASDVEVQEALAFFLAYYRQHMLDNTVLYPGVRQALDEFRSHSIPMAVLTNKPIFNSQAIVDGLGLHDHFFRVYGGNSFEQKKPDPLGVNRLREEVNADRESTLMIGDSAVDVMTARNAGIRVCGVTYGFQPQSLRESAPDYLLHTMQELVPIVLATSSAAE